MGNTYDNDAVYVGKRGGLDEVRVPSVEKVAEDAGPSEPVKKSAAKKTTTKE